jgi:hypothetical protein
MKLFRAALLRPRLLCRWQQAPPMQRPPPMRW